MNASDVRAICGVFDLGDPIAAPTAVNGGLVNRMWRVETTRGAFAVKEMNLGLNDFEASLPRAFRLEQAAFAAGVPMPRPIPVAGTGRCCADIPGAGDRLTAVRVHAWVEGAQLENSTRHPAETAARSGQILAQIHALRMKADVSPAVVLGVIGGEHWALLAERAERSGCWWTDELRNLLPVLADLEAYVVAARGDPTELLLSHRDSDPKNFLRTAEGDLLLVDWDTAGPVNPRHDLANQALVWAGLHLGDPDPLVARAVVEAYRRNDGLAETFRHTDLAETFRQRLAWVRFNVRRALGELRRDETDRRAGENVIRRNVSELPRFARSIDQWLDELGE